MSQDFEIPPMGADNLPLKEMETEVPPIVEPQAVSPLAPAKKNPKNILIMGIIILFALVAGLMLGAKLKPAGQPSEPKPSASAILPSPEAVEPTKEPQNTKERLDNLSTKIEETDFKEQSLQPPIIDFKIRFELQQ